MKKALCIVCYSLNLEIIDYYNKFTDKYIIIIVTPTTPIKIKYKYEKITFYNDDFFLVKNDFENIYISYFNKFNQEKKNWYYQQFLKYYIIFNLDYDYIHIIDGDSILSEKHFFSNNILYTQHKINYKYNNLIKQFYLRIVNKNMITNQMLFSKVILESMINYFKIESSKYDFIHFILRKMNQNEFEYSEYQLYASYLILIQECKFEKIKVFRRFDLINNSIEYALTKYSLVSFEYKHKKDILRIIKAKIFFYFKLNNG
ncbi:MAG: hypothetical protein K2X69_04385 [Silvanigrellaceae bacterium]|nr:hypothetical protein [Silvanigrellaceae bacterium]